jgi:hypothetical protein
LFVRNIAPDHSKASIPTLATPGILKNMMGCRDRTVNIDASAGSSMTAPPSARS